MNIHRHDTHTHTQTQTHTQHWYTQSHKPHMHTPTHMYTCTHGRIHTHMHTLTTTQSRHTHNHTHMHIQTPHTYKHPNTFTLRARSAPTCTRSGVRCVASKDHGPGVPHHFTVQCWLHAHAWVTKWHLQNPLQYINSTQTRPCRASSHLLHAFLHFWTKTVPSCAIVPSNYCNYAISHVSPRKNWCVVA